MRQVKTYVSDVAFDNTTDNYSNFFDGCSGNGVSAPGGTTPWAVAGYLKYVRIEQDVASGAGASWTHTLRLGSLGSLSDTSMVIEIAGATDVAGVWEGSIPIAAGQLGNLRSTPSSGPAPSGSPFRVTYEFEPIADDESHYSINGGTVTSIDLFWGGLGAGTTNASVGVGADVDNIVPIAGTITQIFGYIGTAAQASDITCTVFKNGIAQDGSGGTPDTRMTISAGVDVEGYASISVELDCVPGDLLHVQCERSGFSRAVSWACRFKSDSAGKFIMPAVYQGPDPSTANYLQVITSDGGSTWWTLAAINGALTKFGPTTMLLTNLYVSEDDAPGAGKTRTYDVRLDGTNTGLSVELTGTDTPSTGENTSDVAISTPFGTLTLAHTPSGTPTIGRGRLSFAMEDAVGVNATRLADGVIRTNAVTSIDSNGFTVGSEQSQAGISHWWQAFDTGFIGNPENEATGGIFEADAPDTYDDNGIPYESRVTSKQFILGGILRRFGVLAAAVLVTPASGESLQVDMIRDYGKETIPTFVSLTPTAEEGVNEYLLRQLDNMSMSDLLSLQIRVTDNSGTFPWSMDQMVMKMSDQEPM